MVSESAAQRIFEEAMAQQEAFCERIGWKNLSMEERSRIQMAWSDGYDAKVDEVEKHYKASAALADGEVDKAVEEAIHDYRESLRNVEPVIERYAQEVATLRAALALYVADHDATQVYYHENSNRLSAAKEPAPLCDCELCVVARPLLSAIPAPTSGGCRYCPREERARESEF